MSTSLSPSNVSAVAASAPPIAARGVVVHPVVARMGGAHFVVDWFSNTLAPLMPLLIPRLGLSLTGAGTLAMLFQLSSSLTQLLFGALADRGHATLLARGGALLTIVVLGTLGLCRTWNEVVLVLVIGGLGVAAFHPAGAMLAHRHSLGKPGLSMAIYVTSGTLGFAVGPVAIALVAERLGLHWAPLLIAPGLLVAATLLWRLPADARLAPSPSGRFGFGALRPYARPLALLYFLVVIRGFVSSALSVFLPVLLTSRGESVTMAAATVTMYSLSGGMGGFFGGVLADRIGHRTVILASMLVPVPFLVAAPLVPPVAAMLCMAVAGFFMLATLPVNVSFGQLIAPVSAATVASLLMGLAWGAGALIVPITGMLGDWLGLQATLVGLGLVPLLGVALAWPLPRRVE